MRRITIYALFAIILTACNNDDESNGNSKNSSPYAQCMDTCMPTGDYTSCQRQCKGDAAAECSDTETPSCFSAQVVKRCSNQQYLYETCPYTQACKSGTCQKTALSACDNTKNPCPNGYTCADGECLANTTTACVENKRTCNGNDVVLCQNGTNQLYWKCSTTCIDGACDTSVTAATCTNGAKQCSGQYVQACVDGGWVSAGSACPNGCQNGECIANGGSDTNPKPDDNPKPQPAAPKANGEACDSHSQCQSGYCSQYHVCDQAPSGETDPQPEPEPKANGEACDSHSQCQSGYCNKYRCANAPAEDPIEPGDNIYSKYTSFICTSLDTCNRLQEFLYSNVEHCNQHLYNCALQAKDQLDALLEKNSILKNFIVQFNGVPSEMCSMLDSYGLDSIENNCVGAEYYDPTGEVCDGIDNDGDTLVDEGGVCSGSAEPDLCSPAPFFLRIDDMSGSGVKLDAISLKSGNSTYHAHHVIKYVAGSTINNQDSTVALGAPDVIYANNNVCSNTDGNYVDLGGMGGYIVLLIDAYCMTSGDKLTIYELSGCKINGLQVSAAQYNVQFSPDGDSWMMLGSGSGITQFTL